MFILSLARLPLSLVLLAWIALWSVAADAASVQAQTEQVRVELIASVNAVHPGDRIVLGVHQRIIPHWHTYWRNPGDSGLATTIDWNLPQGAVAGEIQWPTPDRFSVGPVTNYGYENEVTLLSEVEVPATLVPGTAFVVNAQVSWLVCKEVCLPQEAALELRLPVVPASMGRGPGHPLIETARARLPVSSPWPVQASVHDKGLVVDLALSEVERGALEAVWFYPYRWGVVAHDGAQHYRGTDGRLRLELPAGQSPLKAGERLEGVLVITERTSGTPVSRGFELATDLVEGPAPSHAAELGLFLALGLAFLGGMILNLMPCVFPVLSIKALSLLRHAQSAPGASRAHGVAYTAGVLLSFLALAGVLIVLKQGGAQVGWGFQFQSPVFVLVLAYLVFAVGLNLSGVFSINLGGAGLGTSLAAREGWVGSFFTGVLATVVATPCTAPFMGVALGYALTQPALSIVAVFLCLGLGLAMPYLILSFLPALQRRLPRPGPWMERLRQALAFPMYATAVWLVWVLAQQAGADVLALALAGMVVLALAAWLFELSHGGRARGRMLARVAAAVLAVGVLAAGGSAGGYPSVGSRAVAAVPAGAATADGAEPYSPERLSELRAAGTPVFLNMTAAWCITCLVNERVALADRSVLDTFERAGVVYMKGDWTQRDDRITRLLADFGRSGVPLYVLFSPGAEPHVLPQMLTPALVAEAVSARVLSPFTDVKE